MDAILVASEPTFVRRNGTIAKLTERGVNVLRQLDPSRLTTESLRNAHLVVVMLGAMRGGEASLVERIAKAADVPYFMLPHQVSGIKWQEMTDYVAEHGVPAIGTQSSTRLVAAAAAEPEPEELALKALFEEENDELRAENASLAKQLAEAKQLADAAATAKREKEALEAELAALRANATTKVSTQPAAPDADTPAAYAALVRHTVASNDRLAALEQTSNVTVGMLSALAGELGRLRGALSVLTTIQAPPVAPMASKAPPGLVERVSPHILEPPPKRELAMHAIEVLLRATPAGKTRAEILEETGGDAVAVDNALAGLLRRSRVTRSANRPFVYRLAKASAPKAATKPKGARHKPTMSDRIIDHLRRHPNAKIADVSRDLGTNLGSTMTCMTDLCREGRVVRVGTTKPYEWRVKRKPSK